MKKAMVFLVVTVLGGAAALILRMMQHRTGFEPDTGLPVAGDITGIALIVLLFALAAVLLVLTRRLPEGAASFPFATEDRSALVLPVLGVFLVAFSGVVEILEGLGMGNMLMRLQAQADPYGSAVGVIGATAGSRVQLVLGVLNIVCAFCLFCAVLLCRGINRKDSLFRADTGLLTVPVVLVVRLVLAYRKDSVNPVLAAYYVELLALVFLILGFYRFASFAVGAGRTRHFAWYTGMATICALAALTDNRTELAVPLLYMGGALTLLGFLFLQQNGSTAEKT